MTILIDAALIYIASNVVVVIALGSLGWWRNRSLDRNSEKF